MMTPHIAISWISSDDKIDALSLAKKLHLPLSNELESPVDYFLELDQGQLFLVPQHTSLPFSKPFCVDFTQSSLDYRRQKSTHRNEAIARAVGLTSKTSPSVIDTTAGWGTDSFLLASLGCQVMMIEKTPIIAALLSYGLSHAQNHGALTSILSRLSLTEGDAIPYLESLTEADFPDVIYCDPMFPETEKSALVKKEMQIIQQLTHDPEANDALLTVSLKRAKKRVVVKRPNHASCLSQIPPHHQIKGKKYRFDVYDTAK